MITARAVAAFIVRWRWLVLLASLAAVAVPLSGMRHVTFSADYRAFFSEDNEQLLAFDELQQTYAKTDTVLFVLKPPTGDIFTREFLASLSWVTNEAWQIPHSLRVDSLTNYQHTRVDGDNLEIDYFVRSAENLTDEQLAEIRRVGLSEPDLAGRLVARDGRTAGVLVTLQLPENDPAAVAAAVGRARAIVAQLNERRPGLLVALTGLAPVSNSYPEASGRDLSALVPAMYGLIVVTMLLLSRSLAATATTVVAIALAAGAALGFSGWAGIALTPPTAMVPTIVLTVVVADAMHILLVAQAALRRGKSKRAALEESIAENLVPVTVTALTTVVGFLSLNFSEIPPYRDMGNMAAFGVLVAWFLALSFVPAAAAILPTLAVLPLGTHERQPLAQWADFVIAHRRAILVAMAVVTAGLTLATTRLEINDRIIENFDESFSIRRDSDFAVQNLTGVYQLEFSVDSGQAYGIADPEYLQRLDGFATWLRGQSEVVHVAAVSDIIQRINRSFHEDDPAYHSIPPSKELAAHLLLMYENSLPYGLNLSHTINMDRSATRVVATLGALTTKDIIAVKERAEAWLLENGPASARAVEGTGIAVVFAYLSHRNIEGMLIGTAVSFITICLILAVFLGSWRLGLLSVVPNFLPILSTFGLWALVVGEIATPASMVAVVCMGVIDDATVHLLVRYRRARRDLGLQPPEAVRSALAATGWPLVVTSLLMVGGFAVLGLSPFRMNSEFGIMAATTLAFGLAIDFLLLPALLASLGGAREQEPAGAGPGPAPAPASVEQPMAEA